jgi:aminoglycoside 2'-N-acetyltransferase I
MNADISIETRRTRDLNESERAAITALCTAAHNVDFGSLFALLPPEGLHTMAYDGPEIVSHAVVTTRWLEPQNLPLLRTAYVDAVATHPLYQGKGIGSAMMKRLESCIQAYEIGCLETDRISFYARLGWEKWRGALAARKGTELLPTPDQTGIMILRLARTPPLDLDTTLTIEYDGRLW